MKKPRYDLSLLDSKDVYFAYKLIEAGPLMKVMATSSSLPQLTPHIVGPPLNSIQGLMRHLQASETKHGGRRKRINKPATIQARLRPLYSANFVSSEKDPDAPKARGQPRKLLFAHPEKVDAYYLDWLKSEEPIFWANRQNYVAQNGEEQLEAAFKVAEAQRTLAGIFKVAVPRLKSHIEKAKKLTDNGKFDDNAQDDLRRAMMAALSESQGVSSTFRANFHRRQAIEALVVAGQSAISQDDKNTLSKALPELI